MEEEDNFQIEMKKNLLSLKIKIFAPCLDVLPLVSAVWLCPTV